MTSRRLTVALLLLAVGLTACGRNAPTVVADDGRGGDRRTDTIWIPETRDVDPGPDTRAAREDRPEREDRPDRPKPASPSAASPVSRDPQDAETRDPHDGDDLPAAPDPGTEASAPSHDDAPSSDPREDERSPQPPRSVPPGSHAQPAGPTGPEPVDGCGDRRDQRQPSRAELEREAETLRAEVAARWPQTHGGVWVTNGARPEIRVAFTEQVRENVELLCESAVYPDRLSGARVVLSAHELEQARDRALEERDALRAGHGPDDLPEVIRDTDGRYLVTVDQPTNALVVVLETPTDELQEAFRARYTVQLRVEQGAVGEEPDGSSSSPDHEQETA